MAHLIIENGPMAGEIYPVRDQPVTIGRSNLSHIHINDRCVSRNHAVLKCLHGTFVVEDVSSRNGTLLNGSLLNGRKRLIHGDRICVGGICMRFQLDSYTQELVGTVPSKDVKLVDMGLPAEISMHPLDSDIASKVAENFSAAGSEIGDAVLKLQTIYRITAILRENTDLQSLLGQITDIIYEILTPDRIVIFLNSRDKNPILEPVIFRVRENLLSDNEINVSQGVLDKAVQNHAGVLISDSTSDERFASNSSILAGQIKSVITAPLVVGNEVVGAIYLDRQYSAAESYTTADLDFLVSIANHTAVVILNARLHKEALDRQRLEKELEIAHEIQTNLLPKEVPLVQGLDMSGMSIPARQVGGDCYDFFKMGESQYGIMVLDVSGKGIPAAILTASIRASLRVEAIESNMKSVAEILESVNSWTCRDTANNMFATMVLTVFNEATRTITYSVAGHVPPIILRRSGEVELLETGGCFLGIMEPVGFEMGDVSLDPGDILVLYSDGVTDAQNLDKELFGFDRFVDLIKRHSDLSATELRDEIYEAILKFTDSAEQFDDLTLIVVKALEDPNAANNR